MNGKPFAALDGWWRASDWQTVLDEWAILAPSRSLYTVRITQDGVHVQLAAAEKTHKCNPVINRSLDGRNVSAVCMVPVSSSFRFAGVTGQDLAKAAAGVMSSAGIGGGTDVKYVLSSQDGRLKLTVSRGSTSGSVLVGP